ncbi:MAG: macro domain-containing protein [Firmicutes bacterium]|nr:macro domain-containing protein [Bacillota bacterium]
MKIFLLDANKKMIEAWQEYFNTAKDVEMVHCYFNEFMETHPEIDAVVSPANSFGLMDGGYDAAITEYFGKELMKRVQETIVEKWRGEQPVGISLTVPIDEKRVLIHTPSMRTPEEIKDPRIIYQCMRTTLIEALNHGAENILIPAFGGRTGKVPYKTIAKMMFLAYEQVQNPPAELNWRYALGVARGLED